MKDASDLRSKAKDRRRERRNSKQAYKDPDRVNFKNSKEAAKHERNESKEESDVEMAAYSDQKKKY